MGRFRLDPWPLHARCPGCGEVSSHRVLSVGGGGRTRRVRCQSCGHEWVWERAVPSETQLSEAERRKPTARRDVRTCPWCGREFVPARNAIWCSDDCRERGRRHHRSAIAGLIAQAELLDQKMREVG